MSVLVKGMKMPKTCIKCLFAIWGECEVFPIKATNEEIYKIAHGRLDDCPLEEVKDESK